MNKCDYRRLPLKASSERTGIDFEASTLDEMDAIETRINEQLISWYKRFAKTNHVDFDTASQVLKKARSGDWKMTLEFYAKS
ncbi:hypothetical protein GA840_04145 [Pediococcus ethanolidurans]|nr:hypothetical protein [Pediococcus ethanolidurans]